MAQHPPHFHCHPHNLVGVLISVISSLQSDFIMHPPPPPPTHTHRVDNPFYSIPNILFHNLLPSMRRKTYYRVIVAPCKSLSNLILDIERPTDEHE